MQPALQSCVNGPRLGTLLYSTCNLVKRHQLPLLSVYFMCLLAAEGRTARLVIMLMGLMDMDPCICTMDKS